MLTANEIETDLWVDKVKHFYYSLLLRNLMEINERLLKNRSLNTWVEMWANDENFLRAPLISKQSFMQIFDLLD